MKESETCMEYPGSLHNHSDYSNLRLLDAISTTETLIKYAIELGHSVIAITEHETISNAIKIEELAETVKDSIKVIRGNEIYLCRDGLTAQNFVSGEDKYWHFILLAKDAIGHQQIRELSTRAWMRSFETARMTRVPTYYQDLIEIVGANPGHVIGSTGCLGGFLPSKILQWVNMGKPDDLRQKILGWCNAMENIFGKGFFYFELQPSYSSEQKIVNNELITLSKELNIPFIITTDTHYCRKSDAAIHKAFLKSQNGEREVESFYASTYLMGTQEIEEYMGSYISQEDLQTAYQNILNIQNMCEDYSLKKPLVIPSLKWKIPKHYDMSFSEFIPYLKIFYNSDFAGDRVLAQAIDEKLNEVELFREPEYFKEINSNLEAVWKSSEVNKAHWSAYLLNLQNIISVCWDAGTLVGCGRGSGVGFFLLYLLDITQIDPLRERTKTFSWRFLNPDRASPLDIDVDIEGTRRAQVIEGLRSYYGEDRVANVATFGTIKGKTALAIACRGLDIDTEESLYMSSLIPSDRGTPRTLKQCYYGDEEDELRPIVPFVQKMKEYPEVWEMAQRIEGIVARMGIHAGGIIFVTEPFTNSTALMRAPNGDIITQFDLHDDEKSSLIKMDLLSVEALDKIHTCLDLLCENGEVQRGASLKETYENTIGIYNLERDAKDMWQMVWDHKILSLFQMEQPSGINGIAKLKPNSVDELAILNSVIRLMSQEKGGETPTEKLARLKANPVQWETEMAEHHLTEDEKELLREVLSISYGLSITQEQFMQLVQSPKLGGFSLSWADGLRKAIAKKNPAAYETLTKEFYEETHKRGIREEFADYVWRDLIALSRGYGFNASHTLAYSLIALQEMNLCYHYPIIYWNCACLMTDSGGEDGSTDYNKIATAIGKMRNAGIQITLPDINEASFGFRPIAKENKIVYGLRGISYVGTEIIEQIMAGRPYTDFSDFMKKNPKLGKRAMIPLIKGGAFDSLGERIEIMRQYIWSVSDTKTTLNLRNMRGLMKNNLIPEEYATHCKVFEFNRYLKANCVLDEEHYSLNDRCIEFLISIDAELLILPNQTMKIKAWEKIYKLWMEKVKTYIAKNQEALLNRYNMIAFNEEWEKYALGNYSSWEMEALCFYYHEHELAHVNTYKYGIVNYSSLPEVPPVDYFFEKGERSIPIYKLSKICGTCIAKDKNKGLVFLLTTEGVVTVRFSKEVFSMFDKQISARQEDGSKKVLERSWFKRGSMLVIQGIRRGDEFIPKKYQKSGGHLLYKIDEIEDNNDLILRTERLKGEEEEDSDD